VRPTPLHILVAVDGSPGALAAVASVAALPLPERTRVTLLHVLTRYTPTHSSLPEGLLGGLRADEDARANALLDTARHLLERPGITVAQRVAEGHPAQVIVNRAVSKKVNLLVLGALGITAWARTLLGSTSQAVIKHAPCPVWVVRGTGGGVPEPRQTPFTVLVATDGSASARNALNFVATLPLPAPRVAHLLQVLPSLNEQLNLIGAPLDPPVLEPLYEIGSYLERRSHQLLDEQVHRLSPAFADVRTHVREGDPRRVILACADELDVDLIVMGSQGLTGLKEFLLGSVSHKVAKHSHRSILLVPGPDTDAG